MPDTELPFTLSLSAILTGALDALRDLRDETLCNLAPDGHCNTHGWYGATACPQLRTRLLLQHVSGQALPSAYGITVLRALLRGLTPGQQLHARVRVNGHSHRARLVPMVADPTADSGPDDVHIAAHLSCGDMIERIDPADVLEVDVHTEFDDLLGQSSLGAPRVTAAADALREGPAADQTPDPR